MAVRHFFDEFVYDDSTVRFFYHQHVFFFFRRLNQAHRLVKRMENGHPKVSLTK